MLLAALATSDDPRATAISAALASKVSKAWDLDNAQSAVSGGSGNSTAAGGSGIDGEVAALRRLTALTAPDPADVADRAAQLRSAVARADATAGTPAADARRVAGLLRAGLSHRQEHGDSACPLCGVGTLDGTWRVAAAAEADRFGVLAKEADDADLRLRDALAAAHALVERRPDILGTDPTSGLTAAKVVDAVAEGAVRAQGAWDGLRAVVDPAALADELVVRHTALVTAVDALRSAARSRLGGLETAWSPLARQAQDWLDTARRARSRQPHLAALKEAGDFLKRLLERLRDERLAPFATQQQAIWAELRQESNVDLGPVRLRGTATRRRLVLDVTVDGTGGTALGVMSQGELHTLGLALFLPRATVPESPFRFVVIDDPVQAMDPAKVDGLARVLLRTAETRQVVVFTHDDRLADAVRRFSPSTFPTYHLDVIHAEQSVVDIRPSLDPATRWWTGWTECTGIRTV
ncbi:AAA family ATPase [Frankia sp. CiP3]|uniref:AAA family ATPase n=1 Tax=Frankia sp. CiP3 TaxID=2880971 RepID=UPI001EF5A424|nr:AAA family ATPase [Frankia sp. CiP3]